ncbi:GlsB/YeaQ/YmgE family stress response membrane protein, partial [Dactylosporangium sp. NPDC005572]|uniref:GlsB/YeaQ/YmgE family stress response membrane protein n=1 Tax=Dactylosporangium sp. NPDC005572 TaxID=3156889 RepID=UPI0033AF1CBE
MTISGIISALIVGAIVGVLGRLAVPGKQAIPIWLTVAIGIVAALIGTAIARAFGWANTPGIDWLELITQVVLAAVGVWAVAGFWCQFMSVVPYESSEHRVVW